MNSIVFIMVVFLALASLFAVGTILTYIMCPNLRADIERAIFGDGVSHD